MVWQSAKFPTHGILLFVVDDDVPLSWGGERDRTLVSLASTDPQSIFPNRPPDDRQINIGVKRQIQNICRAQSPPAANQTNPVPLRPQQGSMRGASCDASKIFFLLLPPLTFFLGASFFLKMATVRVEVTFLVGRTGAATTGVPTRVDTANMVY